MRLIDAARTRLRLLFRRRADEARIDEEFRFHLDMETERLVRDEGLDPAEARRRAVRAFGVVEDHKDALHEGRGLARLGSIALDLKLGIRMLVKYPGLTVVGGLAMAFAIWAGAVVFEILGMLVSPALPLPEGDRVVQLRLWDARESSVERRALHDFAQWRGRLRTVTDVGAFRDVQRNVRGSDGDTRPVEVAEITTSAFRIAGARPLLGRTLLASDEQPGAPLVVLLGHDLWQTRFAGDSGIVGRTVQVGEAFATVVGVMPEGFAFPIAHHAWMPLPGDSLHALPREGPSITMFGRLAPAASLEEAQAELTALGRRTSAELPATHADLRPEVKPFTTVVLAPQGSDLAMVGLIQFFVLLLFVVICSNVAMLLFARMATRENELIVRTALGATRGRIVAQLFAEALVLGAVAAIVGLGAAAIVLGGWAKTFLEENLDTLPFWIDPKLSPTTVAYVAGLTVFGAAIAGALPALRVTKRLGTRLKEATAGGGGLRFGGVWTAVIVTQVALTVAFPAVTYFFHHQMVRIRAYDAGFPTREYLAARVDMTSSGTEADTTAAARAQQARTIELLRQRVAADPAVIGVTFVDNLPRDWHPDAEMEVEGAPGAAAGAAQQDRAVDVNTAGIDPSYFDVLGAPVLAGRAFHAGDLRPDVRVVIVDQEFVRQMLHGADAVGRRVRPVPRDADPASPQPWFEIVGVVKDLGMGFAGDLDVAAGLYFPVPAHLLQPIQMVVHTRGAPMSVAPRIRAIAASVDPDVRLSEVQSLDEVTSGLLWLLGMWLRITTVLTAITLVLSLAGIYAVLSFTVARRTREIGIRVALGATHRQVIAAVFRRPLTQVALGVLAGGTLIAVATLADLGDGELLGRGLSPAEGALLVGYILVMLGVCLLACVVPTRRALGVEPSVALRVE